MSEKSGAGFPLGILAVVGVALVGGAIVVGLAVVAIVGVLAAIAIPNFVVMQLKAKRSEVPGYVDGLKTAELAYDAAFDTYVPVGSRAAAEEQIRWNGKEPRAWDGGGEWETLGWSPDGMSRGAYWVEVEGHSFTVHGLCDVDGDGDFAEYVATERENARMVTGPNTY